MLQNQLHDLMQKEMSRKEFLATLGFGIASIFGFSAFLHLLDRKSSQTRGYGSSSYGGNKEL